jgi:hypothetical protein
MANALPIVGLVVGLCILAMFLLGARDARRWRRQVELEEQLPIAERIANIRDGASLMIRELQRVQADGAAEGREAPDWMPPVLEYYRRLEALTSVAEPSAAEALRLADDASRYIREHRIKGIRVATQARKLAELFRRRDAA